MFPLKPISKDAIPRTLAKAERYRMLNEPREAESICEDVLAVEPGNQEALVILLLSLTDQFETGAPDTLGRARAVLARLNEDYAKAYYAGVIAERHAKAMMHRGERGHSPVPGQVIYHWITEAMQHFERARSLAEPRNDDAILRWNTCVRLLAAHPSIRPLPEQLSESEAADEDVPMR